MSKDYTDICGNAPEAPKALDRVALEDAVETLETSLEGYIGLLYGESETFDKDITLELRILAVAKAINSIS